MSRFALCGTIRSREQIYPLRRGLNRVGSAPGSDVELPFRGVSRHHARLTLTGDGGFVEDLASRNGTYVNGRKVASAPVAANDRLRFGPIELALRPEAEEETALALSWHSPDAIDEDALETTFLGDHPSPRAGAAPSEHPPFPPGYVPCVSPLMIELYGQLALVAKSTLPVLVTGETGSGKEWIARILHAWSDRSRGPLVTLNCAALPAHLVEAQLFGIGKGVATGVEARAGKFLVADGGTLFLDEVTELPPELQGKLLRVLEEKAVEPLGEARRPIDVRVVSATNERIEERVDRGAFRADLYFRLAGAVVDVPPLRRRPEDVPVLVRAFAEQARRRPGHQIRGFTRAAMERLASASWPGNVRQLKHEIDRLVLTQRRGQTIDSAKVGVGTVGEGAGRRSADGRPLDLKIRVAELEARLIEDALRRTGGNRSEAARVLGLSRNGLAIKMRRLGVDAP